MARQMTPVEMVAAFRKWKVDLNLYPGYATRGYGPGSISDAQGVVIHHTGSDAQSDSYLKFLFVDGRGDVPAPLCNFATDMDGDLWLGAAERANHAGMGSSATLVKIKAGSSGYDWRNTTIRPGPDNINGNGHYYGNEVRFDGGQPMTKAMWNTVVLSSAAICDFHKWGAWRVIGHKEHTSRKPDPGSTLMYMLRRDIDAALKAGPGNWPAKQQSEEISVSAETNIINKINAVSAHLALNTAQNRQTLFRDIATLIQQTEAGQTEQVLAYIRQTDAANDAQVAELKIRLDAANAKLAEVDAQTEPPAPKA